MPAKWKEVSAYTGQSVEEDAPTNAIAHGYTFGHDYIFNELISLNTLSA